MAYLSCLISVGVGALGSMPALGSLAGLPSLSSGSGDPTRIGIAAITLGSQSRRLSNSIGPLAVPRVSIGLIGRAAIVKFGIR